MTATPHWQRELPDFVLVTVDGLVQGLDPDVTTRASGRVVIAMPDFTADAVAHALDTLGELADRLHMDRDWTGERELAAALREAAEAAGYCCPSDTGRSGEPS
jgi:hypothetical protein